MDFVYLVEHGKYSADDIKDPRAQGFIEGMEYVLRTDVENFLANYFITTESEQLNAFEKIQFDVVKAAIEELRYYIHGSICESIVVFCDDETEAEEEPDDVEA